MPDKEQSPSVTELCERLRDGDDLSSRIEAAARLEALHAEREAIMRHLTSPTPDLGKDEELCERLRIHRVILKSGDYDGAQLMAAWCDMENAAARIEALHAEREKLREAVGAFLICIRDLPKDSLARKAFSHVENLSHAALSIGETDYCGIVEDSPDAP